MSDDRKEKERRIVAFVEEKKGEAIVDEVATAVGVTRSTARKYLAGLVDGGELERSDGGRERGRKRPDRFSVAKGKRGKKEREAPSAPASKARLGPGELDGLVLADMREHRGDAPHSPSRIAKRIGRSSGAVANCLRRLAQRDRAVLASEKPRAYDLPEGE